MNKTDLYVKFKSEKVPEYCYCLEGGLPNDRFVLNKNEEMWEVYYTERGEIFEHRKFLDEESACNYLYHRVKKMLDI